ncbi:nicotinate-nucleotide adenylyltransferase [Cephaloticoccus primus]|uniref:nicotinate-nucleotide adenylyltransferase n=1 Tax=Cephaloticoccus primus TaxID=1548207 RepID=UPI000839248F|nr:nicotinate-nucleotide adenylyltransferase [Cephaloticoccus primus]
MLDSGDSKDLLTTHRKALRINLDTSKYGTFAEIGAGQEVARVFFQAGGASGTVAKTISAYDMTFSDAIYGKAPRYVSQERLLLMLDHEFELLRERLAESRGAKTQFFVFADTVSARNYSGTNEQHGWMGVRFQPAPAAEPSEIVLHVRMSDKDNLLQQEALGIVGTNLVYAAFYYRHDPQKFIASLLDHLSPQRIEIDMLEFRGPEFAHIDNRLTSLLLVHYGLTNAVMFGPGGSVLQPSEVLRKKAILVERGSFRPVTHVNVDMLKCAAEQFMQEPLVKDREVVVLMEITVLNLIASGEFDSADFLSRVDLLGAIGFTVLISNYSEFYRLTAYFRRYTKEMIGMAMGITNLVEIFNEKYYDNLEGGILESLGRLFRHSVKLYVYPMLLEAYQQYISTGENGTPPAALPSAPNAPGVPDAAQLRAAAPAATVTARNIQVAPHLRNLYAHLQDNCYIECLTGYNPDILHIFSREVLRRIRAKDPSWEELVPDSVATVIKARELFSYKKTETENLPEEAAAGRSGAATAPQPA